MEDTTGQSQATNEQTKQDAPKQKKGKAVVDTTPTRDEAREMFKDNPGLWSVITTDGPMTRDQC